MKQEDKNNTGLPENAFRPLNEGEEYRPLMSPDKVYPEVNFWSVSWGIAMAVLFSAAAAYLGFQIILIICAMVFIIETLSVMIQVTSFKLTGKRVFKMSPIHHHFEMCGFKETKIVLMFTIATAVFSLIAFFAI